MHCNLHIVVVVWLQSLAYHLQMSEFPLIHSCYWQVGHWKDLYLEVLLHFTCVSSVALCVHLECVILILPRKDFTKILSRDVCQPHMLISSLLVPMAVFFFYYPTFTSIRLLPLLSIGPSLTLNEYRILQKYVFWSYLFTPLKKRLNLETHRYHQSHTGDRFHHTV